MHIDNAQLFFKTYLYGTVYALCFRIQQPKYKISNFNTNFKPNNQFLQRLFSTYR